MKTADLHPLFPLLSCLLEKCELATCSPSGKNDGSSVCTAASFNEDLEEFVKLKAHEPSFYRPNPELDQVMLLAIRVLRIHLLELEKVHDLCDDFCRKYVSSLKQKIPVDVVNEERTGSGRPPSSMSSPSGTAGSSSSPIVGTPINMPMYPQSYDNHMAPSVDSHTSHNVSWFLKV
uniref:MEIS N-terminal domain-containing protein n=1 Tax=Panagrolaimus sp. PS1159 TaxID=55785 RepID=A0AC35FFQ9_9BILA